MLVGFTLAEWEICLILGMAKGFSGCLGAAQDCHLLAKPKSPGSAMGISFSMPGERGWCLQ